MLAGIETPNPGLICLTSLLWVCEGVPCHAWWCYPSSRLRRFLSRGRASICVSVPLWVDIWVVTSSLGPGHTVYYLLPAAREEVSHCT